MLLANEGEMDYVYMLPPVGPNGHQGTANLSPVINRWAMFGADVSDEKANTIAGWSSGPRR